MLELKEEVAIAPNGEVALMGLWTQVVLDGNRTCIVVQMHMQNVLFLQSLDSADVATEQFLHHQEQRTRELESIINSHIEELRYTTDATLKKYSNTPSV